MLETKAILLGTDTVGKTKLLYKLKLNEDVQTIPTIGFNVETISYKDREITIWDVGGGDKIKALWKHYFNKMKCIIFMVDLSKNDRIEEYINAFNILLNQHKDYINIPIIIFGNKFNGIKTFEPNEILQKTELSPVLSPYIIEGNVLTGEGLDDLLEYIYNNIEFTEKEEINNEQVADENNNNNENNNEDNNKKEVKESFKISMFGLDNSGKTKLLYLLKLGEKVITLPSIGFNVEIIENKNWEKNIAIWDIGGQKKIRVLWRHYLKNLNGLIWVYDISDKSVLEESKKELINLLNNQEVNENLPLLIFANKSDLNNSGNDVKEFINGIEEYLNKRPYYIQLCNHDDIESCKMGLEWLYNNIN